jgi:hypothetical protein
MRASLANTEKLAPFSTKLVGYKNDNTFTDSEGVPFGNDDLHNLAGAFRADDGSAGAGRTTIQRAALYRALAESAEARQRFLDTVRMLPAERGKGTGGALEKTHYSTERASTPREAFNNVLDAGAVREILATVYRPALGLRSQRVSG